MPEFMNGAKGLSKNPLGIIALFISLIYGIAALVLTVSSGLDTNQKWPIILFIVTFPFFILVAFCILVIWHHTKLYAPSDFKDEGNFIKISSEVQSKKVAIEIEEVINESNGISVSEAKQVVNTDTSSIPASITVNTPNSTQFTQNIKMQYFLAEDLVFRQLEQEYKSPIQRHMAYKSSNKLVELDGITQSKNETLAFEIKYNKKGHLSRIVLESLYNIASNLDNIDVKNFKLIIALVYEERPVANIDTLKEKLSNLRIPVEIKQYDFNKLKREFGLE